MPSSTHCHLNQAATADLIAWARQIQEQADSPFSAAQQLARRLGAHVVQGRAELGFWTPELIDKAIPAGRVYLEIFIPLADIDFTLPRQEILFRHERLHLEQDGEYLWGVVEGMRPGRRHQVGSFYWLTYQDAQDHWHTIPDVLAYSLPFGAFAPAELYDVDHLQQHRPDRAYYQRLAHAAGPDGIYHFPPPTNILQLHIGTATAGTATAGTATAGTATAPGTIAGLTRLYQRIADKIRNGETLTPAEQAYTAYDAIQPLPVEPTIEYELGPRFWQRLDDGDPHATEVPVDLRRPDMTNWGYDIVLSASSAINPVLLETGRPDELVDLAATLHQFPGQPIMLIFDVVYGHTDNQALGLLNQYWFRGPNMYGQDVNQQHPVVRALMLEMQRRKVNFGADGVRVDGAQDFKTWDSRIQVVAHDDAYLQSMSDVQQEIAGLRYHPWMIFEDGRPWPREDWPIASTYRAVIEQQPDTFQWGPITFAHNTPALEGFWAERWWRFEQIYRLGSHWISGCANHDTVRRGTQIPLDKPINHRLGSDLPTILNNAYDSPAATLLSYASLPGVPMDFINASLRAPWGFIRNTDDLYGVKVVAEEALFLWWQVNPADYDRPDAFPRLKELGFTNLAECRRFMNRLHHLVEITGYDLVHIVERLQNTQPPLAGPPLSIPLLKQIARAFMDDLYAYCNVATVLDQVDPARAQFNHAAREFRRAHPWLIHDLRAEEAFGCRADEQATLFYSLRLAPAGNTRVLFLANMEGDTVDVTPQGLPFPPLPTHGWECALAAPGVSFTGMDSPVQLADSQGLVLVHQP